MKPLISLKHVAAFLVVGQLTAVHTAPIPGDIDLHHALRTLSAITKDGEALAARELSKAMGFLIPSRGCHSSSLADLAEESASKKKFLSRQNVNASNRSNSTSSNPDDDTDDDDVMRGEPTQIIVDKDETPVQVNVTNVGQPEIPEALWEGDADAGGETDTGGTAVAVANGMLQILSTVGAGQSAQDSAQGVEGTNVACSLFVCGAATAAVNGNSTTVSTSGGGITADNGSVVAIVGPLVEMHVGGALVDLYKRTIGSYF